MDDAYNINDVVILIGIYVGNCDGLMTAVCKVREKPRVTYTYTHTHANMIIYIHYCIRRCGERARASAVVLLIFFFYHYDDGMENTKKIDFYLTALLSINFALVDVLRPRHRRPNDARMMDARPEAEPPLT